LDVESYSSRKRKTDLGVGIKKEEGRETRILSTERKRIRRERQEGA
jgi:hypothetical protein